MRRAAVCYCASDGYLFQTVVSAIQARTFVDDTVTVAVVRFGEGRSTEGRIFRELCESKGVRFVDAPRAALDGLGFYYARLFLDRCLPDVEEVLYIDGDTQVVGSLTPLLQAPPPPGGLLAVVDPLVLYSQARASFRRDVDALLDESRIPRAIRGRYVNSGVLRLRAADLPDMRRLVLAARESRGGDTRYPEQDLLNIVLADRIATVSPDWNFPGFLLGTRVHAARSPRIVHFMSNPRPWQVHAKRWRAFSAPYRDIVDGDHRLAQYAGRLGLAAGLRYRAQSGYKWVTETRFWQRPAAASLDWVRTADRPV